MPKRTARPSTPKRQAKLRRRRRLHLPLAAIGLALLAVGGLALSNQAGTSTSDAATRSGTTSLGSASSTPLSGSTTLSGTSTTSLGTVTITGTGFSATPTVTVGGATYVGTTTTTASGQEQVTVNIGGGSQCTGDAAACAKPVPVDGSRANVSVSAGTIKNVSVKPAGPQVTSVTISGGQAVIKGNNFTLTNKVKIGNSTTMGTMVGASADGSSETLLAEAKTGSCWYSVIPLVGKALCGKADAGTNAAQVTTSDGKKSNTVSVTLSKSAGSTQAVGVALAETSLSQAGGAGGTGGSSSSGNCGSGNCGGAGDGQKTGCGAANMMPCITMLYPKGGEGFLPYRWTWHNDVIPKPIGNQGGYMPFFNVGFYSASYTDPTPSNGGVAGPKAKGHYWSCGYVMPKGNGIAVLYSDPSVAEEGATIDVSGCNGIVKSLTWKSDPAANSDLVAAIQIMAAYSPRLCWGNPDHPKCSGLPARVGGVDGSDMVTSGPLFGG